MAYIGNTPADKYQTLQKQSFTTSATDTYTLSYAVTNPQDLALFINNVRQNPNDAYTVSGTTLTLSSAITGSDTMYAVFLGRAVETVAPAIGSVTNSMLANSSITLNGSAVSLGGSATVGGGAFESELLHIQDQKSSGTHAGTSSSDTIHTRVLNTVVTNEITGASLSSNQITLPSGTYYINASCPSFVGGKTKVVLYNTTDSSNEVVGLNGRTDYSEIYNTISARFTISAQKVFEIRHYIGNGRATDGLGNYVGPESGIGPEIYTDVQIWKVA
jgi:hypothetical protein